MNSWIGVDLDGTLAHYTGWMGPDHIGAPVAPMVERVQQWLKQGQDVKIFTARVCGVGVTEEELAETIANIRAWSLEHIGQALEVTCTKDYGMIEIWDDRAVRVEMNTGKVAGE